MDGYRYVILTEIDSERDFHCHVIKWFVYAAAALTAGAVGAVGAAVASC